MPKKSPQCHNSSGCTLWKKCHLFATYGLTYLCRYVHPNGRLLWVSRESSQGNRILLLLSWWTCMLIAAFQLYCTAAAKAWDTKRNWNQLQNKQRYYIWKKGTWDNFRLRKLPKHHFYVGFKNEFSTHWVRKWFNKYKLESLFCQKMRPFRTFSTTVSKQCPKWRVSCFKSWRWWQSSIKYDLCISLHSREKLLPKRSIAFLSSSWQSWFYIERENLRWKNNLNTWLNKEENS